MRQVLERFSPREVQNLLPDTIESLQALPAIRQEDLPAHLRNWQQAQSTRLRHLQFQLTPSQLETVEQAMKDVLTRIPETSDNPNRRGLALYHICRYYLDQRKEGA